jgi:hypothetical protein
MTRRRSRLIRMAAAAFLLTGSISIALSATLLSEPAGAGASSLTVVASDGLTVLTTGGPTTLFTFKLPQGAGCLNGPAQSAHVNGFVVPVGTDVTQLTFSTTGLLQKPAGAYDFFYLEDGQGNVWSGVGTATNVVNGVHQFANSLPNWQWSPQLGPVVPPAQNPITGTGGIIDPAAPAGTSGKWLVGVACTTPPSGGGNPTSAGENVWSAEVDFAASGSGAAQTFTWTAAPASNTTTTTTTSSTTSTTTANESSTSSTTSTTTADESSTTSTSSASSTTSTLSSTTSTASTVAAAAGDTPTSTSGSTTDAATSPSGSLPFTGNRTRDELMFGLVAMATGLLLLAVGRRRAELERLKWPDER